jgi:hypothetical protein
MVAGLSHTVMGAAAQIVADTAAESDLGRRAVLLVVASQDSYTSYLSTIIIKGQRVPSAF